MELIRSRLAKGLSFSSEGALECLNRTKALDGRREGRHPFKITIHIHLSILWYVSYASEKQGFEANCPSDHT
jgi:hypothetical protein